MAAPAVRVDEPLLVSPEDKRSYRAVVLPNGLRAVLVHDPFISAANPGGGDEDEAMARSAAGRSL